MIYKLLYKSKITGNSPIDFWDFLQKLPVLHFVMKHLKMNLTYTVQNVRCS